MHNVSVADVLGFGSAVTAACAKRTGAAASAERARQGDLVGVTYARQRQPEYIYYLFVEGSILGFKSTGVNLDDVSTNLYQCLAYRPRGTQAGGSASPVCDPSQ